MTEELEQIIDATSLSNVLFELELICTEKAAYLYLEQDNERAATSWLQASSAIRHAAYTVEI